MLQKYWVTSMVTGAVLLAGPATTFAATAEKEAAADDISEEEIMNVIDDAAMMDRGGGYIMPPYYGGGVNVDVSVTKEVTPDFVALNAYCDSGRVSSREDAKNELTQIFNQIKQLVGDDGRVRRMGTISAYPYYGMNGEDTGSYTANLSVFVRIVDVSAAQRIADGIENLACGVSWDVRLTNTQDFELDVLDELTSKLNKRKQIFEKLLGRELENIMGVSLNTWADGYSTYDAEVNKVDATTTLNVSFELENARIQSSSTRRSSTPRG